MWMIIIIAGFVSGLLWYVDCLHDWHLLQLATSGMKRKARVMRSKRIDLLNPALIHSALSEVVSKTVERCRDSSTAQEYLNEQFQQIIKRNRV